MWYKYYFSIIQCNRFFSDFMRACDLGGIEDVGVRAELSFTTKEKPTKEYIEMMENVINSTKENKELNYYYTYAKYIRCEVIDEGELNDLFI